MAVVKVVWKAGCNKLWGVGWSTELGVGGNIGGSHSVTAISLVLCHQHPTIHSHHVAPPHSTAL